MFCKNAILNIAQNSQENTCAGVLFNKVAGLQPASLLKKETATQVFSCEFKSSYFVEHQQPTDSVHVCTKYFAVTMRQALKTKSNKLNQYIS